MITTLMVVEAICGFALVIGSIGLQTGRWGWAITAHGIAIGGVLLGMAALAAGRGPSTALNTVYHPTILVALIVTGLLVWRTRRVAA